MITWNDFEKVEIRAETILEVGDFPEAKKSSYKLKVDFGELSIKQSSAQITKLYKKEDLIGKQAIAVTNFPPKQIVNFFYLNVYYLGLFSKIKKLFWRGRIKIVFWKAE